MFFVEVILPLALAKTFTYQVSETEYHFIKKGMRLAVPFGKSKIYTAIAIELHRNEPTLYQAKEIHQILDHEPMVTGVQLQHWFWIASYYMCAIGEVYRNAVPSALLLESETVVTAQASSVINETDLSDEEYLVYQALQQQSSLKIDDIIAIVNKKNVFPIIQKLMDKKILIVQEEI
ncbi:MAG: primosomal protein N', partial [Flavobacterium sp.]|nr:primosomal protein N' [Flavobacterium sp.]